MLFPMPRVRIVFSNEGFQYSVILLPDGSWRVFTGKRADAANTALPGKYTVCVCFCLLATPIWTHVVASSPSALVH